jgi:hypothetical protein
VATGLVRFITAARNRRSYAASITRPETRSANQTTFLNWLPGLGGLVSRPRRDVDKTRAGPGSPTVVPTSATSAARFMTPDRAAGHLAAFAREPQGAEPGGSGPAPMAAHELRAGGELSAAGSAQGLLAPGVCKVDRP